MMEENYDVISEKDKRILRNLAKKQVEHAHCEKNDFILKQWDGIKNLRSELPTFRLLFGHYRDEVVYPRMKCEGKLARDIEARLLANTVGREIFDDDTPMTEDFYIYLRADVYPFGIRPNLTYAKTSTGFHINPVIEDLEEENVQKLKGGSFSVDKEGTYKFAEAVGNVIGDILNVKVTMPSLPGMITNPLVQLMGMENYYMAMYDYPDELHEVMDTATKVYEDYYDFLEKEKLILPTSGFTHVNQDTYALDTVLPSENVTSTRQCWGFLESQETTSVAPETFGEFVYPYQDRLVKRFGLLSYGCCERVDATWPDYLSKWKNLRKLSVSPFNNHELVGDYLRGTDVIYYSKARSEYLTNRGPIDEAALRESIKKICHASRGCIVEMCQREVSTIYGDWERAKRYVQVIKQTIRDYWQP